MEAKNYLIGKLKELCNAIPTITIRYSFDEAFTNHIVEITPLSIYEDDNHYADLEAGIYNDFTEKFPSHTLVFISNEDIISIEHPDHVLTGEMCGIDIETFNWIDFLSSNFIPSPVDGEGAGETNYALAA